MNITPNEEKMLISLFNNAYGENGDCVWSRSHNDSSKPHNLPSTTVPGVLGSLTKKGLLYADDSGTPDAVIGLTKEGQAIAEELESKT